MPIKYASPFDQMEDTFNAIARRAHEIFENNGRALGRDLFLAISTLAYLFLVATAKKPFLRDTMGTSSRRLP